MAPLVLEGETLGQKHRHFNKAVEAAVADETAELLPLNYEESDVDNLVRVDVACRRRNVQYIIDVLQSEDMLYVSRAIKQSTWLITDDQFAHIINPSYLHNELFPKMTTKAKNKLLLAIRLNLKNESRVEEFFNYYKADIKVAQKWLPNCSLETIEKVYTDRQQEITSDTFKRLCEKSISFLKILLKNQNWYFVRKEMELSKILITKFPEEYLEIMTTIKQPNIPNFGIRATQQIMHLCPDKVLKNFPKFANHVHLPTFAKCLKKESIPDFLMKQAENKDMKNWIKYDNIKHFAKYLPIATRFDFIKKLFIDKDTAKTDEPSQISGEMDAPMGMMYQCRAMKCSAVSVSTNANIYRWYRFAAFETAFVDLKKLIRVESSPTERNAILTVLIHCARRNPGHIKTLLQFYREKHMNEPFKFKIQFVNSLLSLVDTHKFDIQTWNILNEIFSSVEVYIESENSVNYCVKAIIVYKLLHNEDVPEVIEKKRQAFDSFDTFEDYRKKLGDKEREILFKYLYDSEINKLNKQTVNNEIELTMAFDLLNKVLTLLKDWKKKITDHPEILEKIRHFIKTKKENLYKNDLSYVKTVEKKWRRDMFEDLFYLEPNDSACIHALKHDPELLQRYSSEIATTCSNDAVSLKHTLHRLRIYWAQSLAQKWAKVYIEGLEKQTGHKATIEGLCILLPRNEIVNLLKKYTPVQTKIDWSKSDPTTLSLQKNIAKRMKLIRPSVNLEFVLSYAKDDYLQFALPSLKALLDNMSATKVSKYIPVFFDSPVSLKKHGLRLAYTKLKFSEIKDIVENMWKNTNNSSIKTILFKETYELLKKAKLNSAVEELWQLLSIFIDNLTLDENRIIYETLGKVSDVPLAVRPQFFVKAYIYINSLPAKANCENIINNLKNDVPKIMDRLEPSFIENHLLPPVADISNLMIGKADCLKIYTGHVLPILASYLTKSENDKVQNAKNEKYLIPILDACLPALQTKKDGAYIVRNNCFLLFQELLNQIKPFALKKSEFQIKTFKEIETKLRTASLEENYRLITYWAIAVLFVESYNNYLKEPYNSDPLTSADVDKTDVSECTQNNDQVDKEKERKWNEICVAVAPIFGQSCLNFIKQDISSQLPALVCNFVRSLLDVFEQVNLTDIAKHVTLKQMLDSELPVTYLIVLKGIDTMFYFEKDEKISELKKQMFEIIAKHPSPDVKIHYHEYMYASPHHFEEAIPYLK